MPAKTKDKPGTGSPENTPATSTPYTLKGFKVKQHVTVPVWSWIPETPKFFTVSEPIHKSTSVRNDTKKSDKEKMEPADVAKVVDLATGNTVTLIFGAVLAGNLRETYPDDAYVGKSFQAVQHKVEGKRYRTYTIAEIEKE